MNKATLILGLAMLLTGFWMAMEFVVDYNDARKWTYRFGEDERRNHLKAIRRACLRTAAPFWIGGLVLVAASFVIGG